MGGRSKTSQSIFQTRLNVTGQITLSNITVHNDGNILVHTGQEGGTSENGK